MALERFSFKDGAYHGIHGLGQGNQLVGSRGKGFPGLKPSEARGI